MIVIKFLAYFSLSFIILSYPTTGNRKVFNHIDDIAAPYTSRIHLKVNTFIKASTVQVSNATQKLFNNTTQDKITSKRSSTKRKEVKLPQDNYTVEEREALLNILRQN